MSFISLHLEMLHSKSLKMIPARLDVRALLLFITAILSVTKTDAQDLPEFNMSNTTISECQGILYDSGGPNLPYGMNENITTVINPGGVITITFSGEFAYELNLDFLSVYDGPDASGILLGTFTGQTLPPVLIANSGSVTFVSTSDTNVSGAGFTAEWVSQQPVPLPPDIAVNTIPVCNASQLNVNLSQAIQCAWLTDAVFTVVANGQNIPVTNVQQNCAGGQTSLVTLTLAQPFTYNCDFGVQLDINIPDNCGIIYPYTVSTQFTFENCGVSANITSSSNTICPGNCAQITAEVDGCFTYTYAWNNGLPATAGPHNVCPTASTTYTVTITETETGNSVVKTFTLGIENFDIITQPQTICQSADDLVLDATGNGEWSGDAVITGTNLLDPDLVGGGITYAYYATEGCTDSVAITVTPIETQFVTAACPGSAPFQLQATPAGGTWDGPNTTVTGMFDPVAAGTFDVNYSVNGCTDVLTVNVDDIGGPFELDSVCQSQWFDTISFAPYGGVWSGTGITDATQGIFAPQQMSPGDHQFTYTINGCAQDFDVYVKQINIDSYHTACPLQTPVVLDNTPIPTGGFWTSPDGAISNANTGLFDPSVIANDTYTYILYNAPNGCIDTMYVWVVETAVDVNELNFCIDDSAVPLDENNIGFAIPEGGTWTGPGITGNVGTGYSFSPATAGLGEHTITYTLNNCSDVVDINVFQNNLPDNQMNFCSSDAPVVLVAGVTPGGTWSGNGVVDATTGLFDPSLADFGTSWIHWSNPAGCSDSVLVNVEEAVEAAITGLDEEYCFVDMTVNFSGTPGGGILLGSLPTYSFNPSILGEGSYQVIYRYTPLYCPQTADTIDFEIYPELVMTVAANDTLICDDQAVTLTATTTGGNPNNGYIYSWSNGGFPVSTNTSTPGTPTTISVSVSDNCSVPVNASIFIDVVPPILSLVDTSDAACAGTQGWATVDVALPDGSYIVEWNNNIFQDTLFANAGTAWTLVITDLVNGCDVEENGVIPAFPSLTANFSITPNDPCIAFEDMSNIAFIDLSQNGVTGTWDFGDGSTQAYVPGQNVNHGYGSPGNLEVTLTIQNEGGCTSSATNTICILPLEPIFIPDIFSPNGDKHNDTLFVRGFGLSKLDFHLYDRWGEEVFFTDDVKKGWDGQLRGQPASSGSYFYTMRAYIGNERKEKSGEIVLVR